MTPAERARYQDWLDCLLTVQKHALPALPETMIGLRQAKGLTQAELAKILHGGKSPIRKGGVVTRVESGLPYAASHGIPTMIKVLRMWLEEESDE